MGSAQRLRVAASSVGMGLLGDRSEDHDAHYVRIMLSYRLSGAGGIFKSRRIVDNQGRHGIGIPTRPANHRINSILFHLFPAIRSEYISPRSPQPVAD